MPCAYCDADKRIRELRMHLKDASNVFSTMSQRLRFFSLPGTQRREIADECRFRADQFREAASDPAPSRRSAPLEREDGR